MKSLPRWESNQSVYVRGLQVIVYPCDFTEAPHPFRDVEASLENGGITLLIVVVPVLYRQISWTEVITRANTFS